MQRTMCIVVGIAVILGVVAPWEMASGQERAWTENGRLHLRLSGAPMRSDEVQGRPLRPLEVEGRPLAPANGQRKETQERSSRSREDEENLLAESGSVIERPIGWREKLELNLGGGWGENVSGTVEWTHLWERVVWKPLGTADNRHRFGIALQHATFDGEDAAKPENPSAFDGEKYFVGGGYWFNRWKKERGLQFGLQTGYLFRKDHGNDRQGYFKDQETDMVAAYTQLDYYRKSETWFPRLSLYGYFEWSVTEKLRRKSWIDDRPGDKTYRQGGFVFDVYNINNGLLRPRVGYEVSYEAEQHRTWGTPVVGFSAFRDVLYVEAKYQWGFGNGLHGVGTPDQRALNISLDLYKFGREIARWWKGPVKPGTVGQPLAPAR